MSCEETYHTAKDVHDGTEKIGVVDAFAIITARANGGEFAAPPQRPLTRGGPKVGKVETLLDIIIPPSLRPWPTQPKGEPSRGPHLSGAMT